MKFLVISDIHGAEENLDKLDEQFKAADAVLFAGDFSKFQAPETGKPTLEKLAKKHDVVFSVLGNCDEPELIDLLEEKDMSVQKTLVSYEGLCIAGSGGGTVFTNTTPNERTEEEIVSDFHIVIDQGEQEWNNLIAIMHNPPKDTECDKIESGVHVGSELLRQFIEEYKPLAVITGHIHESAGICKVGETTVINPGALMEGKYAWLIVQKNGKGFDIQKTELCSL